MQRILYGTDFVSNRERVLQEVRQAADAGQTDLVLIVPENQSHEAERRLCEVCGNRISLAAEVVSLRRFASGVFSRTGGSAVTAFDRGGKLLAMAKTCKQLSSVLKVFAPQGKAEYLLSLVDLCDELESSLVDSKALFHAASQLEGAFAQKIEEIAMIMDVYAAECKGHESELSRFVRLLDDDAMCRKAGIGKKHIWIDGFTYMTRQERKAALQLAELASDFTLVVTGEITDDRDRVFGAAREFSSEFRSLDCGIEQIPAQPGRRFAALEHISDHLFDGPLVPYTGDCAAVQLRHAPSVTAECLACADEILRLVRSGNARFREINVVYTDTSRYQSALMSVFSRYNIPVYYSGTDPIENRSVAAFVLTALDAVSGGMEYEDVLRHLKTGLCALSKEACDLLENYAYTWSIRGNVWFREWTMHPDGFGQPETDATAMQLAGLNEIRRCAMQPLQTLKTGLQAATVREKIRALWHYFDQVDLCGTLDRRAKQLNGTQEAMELSQLYEIVCTALEQMDEVLGENVYSTEEFSRLLRMLLSLYGVATITPSLDHVQAGTAENLYRSSCRYLFVLGAEEGALPSNLSPSGPLSDTEREMLRKQDIPVLSGTEHDLDFAVASVWYLLSSPSTGLYMSWCAADGKAPSFLLSRVETMLPSVQIVPCEAHPTVLLSDARSAGALLARNDTADDLQSAFDDCIVFSDDEVQSAAEELAEKVEGKEHTLSLEAVRKLYGEQLYLSASRVDKQNSCRFAYFMDYGLRAKERRQAAFDAPLFGTFVHAVLEQTAKRTMAEGGFQAVGPERIGQIAEEEIHNYTVEQLQSFGDAGERVKYLFERNYREISGVVDSMVRELQKSDFVPVRFELSFADHGEMPAVTIPGGSIPAEISGFVDRVDVYTKEGSIYVRVIDYKTGRKSFDYTDLLSGIGLQMLIYLFALCELGDRIFGEQPKPAGVLYMPAREPLVSVSARPTQDEAEKEHALNRVRKGLVLDDPAIIQAMEHYNLQPEFLPLKESKNGRTGDLADMAQMEQLRKFVMQRLRRTADEIASGEIAPNPYTRGSSHGACSFCPYAQACHLDSVDGAVRSLATTDRKLFWEKIGQEVANHG